MLARFLLLLWRIQLFSLSSSAAVVLAATAQTAVYPIDAAQRGTEIINTCNELISSNPGVNYPQIALQTTLPESSFYMTYTYIKNGIIPYIQSIKPTTYNTLLIVTYLPAVGANLQYLVVPVEQIVGLLYFPSFNTRPLSAPGAGPFPGPFTASYPNGSLPYFSIDPRHRADDFVNAFTQLTSSPFKTSTSEVWIQTNFFGPFNYQVPAVTTGLLRNVQTLSDADGTKPTLLEIEFLPPNQPTPITMVVTPEQVQQMTYVLNINVHP